MLLDWSLPNRSSRRPTRRPILPASTVCLGTLLEGDATGDDKVDINDFVLLRASFFKVPGQQGFNPQTDFNQDGKVDIDDFALQKMNFFKLGPILVSGGCPAGGAGAAALGAEGLGPLALATVALSLQPPTQTVSVGATFTITIEVAAGARPVDGVASLISFDPTYLEVVSITRGTALPTRLRSVFDNAADTLDYSAGILGDESPTGTFTLATIQFRAKAATSGTTVNLVDRLPFTTHAVYQDSHLAATLSGASVTIQP